MSNSEQGSAPSAGKSNEHYFRDDPIVASAPSTVHLDVAGMQLDLASDRGVFSNGRVDPGTKLLIEAIAECAELPSGPLMDLGCGYGPIATVMALRRPGQQLWAVDINSRALELCETNLLRHASVSTPCHVVRPDEVADDVELAALVSNPPIRVGKSILHDMLERWLDRLRLDGEAWLVVHRHLGADSLARWLADRGYRVERIRSRKGYRILRVTQRELSSA